MADETLKEFIVKVLYESDADSQKRLDEAMTKLDKRFAGLIAGQEKAQKESTERLKTVTREAVLQARLIGDAMEAVASRVVTATLNITSGFDKLYFLSQRTNTSVAGIKSFAFAVAQMGGSAEAAQASIDQLGDKIRSSAGGYLQIFANQGVRLRDSIKGPIRDVNDLLGDLADKLNKDKSPMGQAIEKSIFDSLGLDPGTQQALRAGVGRNQKLFKDMAASMGVDMDRLAADSVKFQNSLTVAGEAVNLVWGRVVQNLMRPDEEGKTFLDRLVDVLVKNGPAIADTAGEIAKSVGEMGVAFSQFLADPQSLKAIQGVFADIKETVHEIVGGLKSLTGLASFLGLDKPLPNSKQTGDFTLFGLHLQKEAEGLTDDQIKGGLAARAKSGINLAPIGNWLSHLGIGGAHADELPSEAGQNPLAKNAAQSDQMVAIMQRIADQTQRVADLLFTWFNSQTGGMQGFNASAGGAASAIGGGGWGQGGVVTGSGAASAPVAPATPQSVAQTVLGHAKRIAGNVLRGVGIKTSLGQAGGDPTGDTIMSSLSPEQQDLAIAAIAKGEGSPGNRPDYNNLTNAMYGPYAAKHGSTGAGLGGIAMFPDLATGRAFTKHMLFDSDSVLGKMSIRDAMEKHTPSSDPRNHPEQHVARILDALRGTGAVASSGDASEVGAARAYLKTISAHPNRAGDIDNLHPEMALRMAAAFKEARANGLPNASVMSGFRTPETTASGYDLSGMSDHDKGTAFDTGGIGSAGSAESLLWNKIAEKHGLHGLYGPNNPAEFNHYQLTTTKLQNDPERQARLRAAGNDWTKIWQASGIPLPSSPVADPAAISAADDAARRKKWADPNYRGADRVASAASPRLNILAIPPDSKDRAHAWSQLQGAASDEDPRDALLRTEAIKARNYDILHRPRPLVHPGAMSGRGGGGDRHVTMGGHKVNISISGVDDPHTASTMIASRLEYQNSRLLAQLQGAVS